MTNVEFLKAWLVKASSSPSSENTNFVNAVKALLRSNEDLEDRLKKTKTDTINAIASQIEALGDGHVSLCAMVRYLKNISKL